MIDFFKKRKLIVTHNGSFHADDLFACATLRILYPYAKIVRTRDEKTIKNADIVLDVGGIYDPVKNRYDHHQKEGAGLHENGIPYASFGLIWKHFGLEACLGNERVWKRLEQKIVFPTDAIDNGVAIVKDTYEGVMPYFADQLFLSFSPTWKEGEKSIDKVFVEQVAKLTPVLKREIEVATADVAGEEMIISAYNESKDKRVVILDQNFPRYLYQDTLCKFDEPVYVIYPSDDRSNWKSEGIRKGLGTLESRKAFPEEWRGKMDDDSLSKETGVKGAMFCHRNGFLLSTKTKEEAIELTYMSLEK